MIHTWDQPEISPNGAHHPAFSWSVRYPTRKWQNSKSYERTRQPIETKGQGALEPVNLLKAGSLTPLSRQGVENKLFTSEERTMKNSNPVNLLIINMVSSVDPVNALKIQKLTLRGGKSCQDRS